MKLKYWKIVLSGSEWFLCTEIANDIDTTYVRQQLKGWGGGHSLLRELQRLFSSFEVFTNKPHDSIEVATITLD